MTSGIRLNNTLLGLVLAHSAVALPFVTVLMEAGIAQLDHSLEVAAARGNSGMRLLKSGRPDPLSYTRAKHLMR